VCLCVLGIRVSCAKTAELIDMPFAADSSGSKELLGWSLDPPMGRDMFEGAHMSARITYLRMANLPDQRM